MPIIPALGLIDRPPESKHTPLPTKAIGRALFSRAVPLHHDELAFALAALAHAEQRAETLFLHFGFAQHLDLQAQLGQRLGAAREFGRMKDIGRLVDQVARQRDAIRHRLQTLIGAPRRARIRRSRV